MATKNTEPKKRGRKKSNEVTFKETKYTLLEESYGKCKLTDGTIHFWVKAEEVER